MYRVGSASDVSSVQSPQCLEAMNERDLGAVARVLRADRKGAARVGGSLTLFEV